MIVEIHVLVYILLIFLYTVYFNFLFKKPQKPKNIKPNTSRMPSENLKQKDKHVKSTMIHVVSYKHNKERLDNFAILQTNLNTPVMEEILVFL